jgi:hypothetical protein
MMALRTLSRDQIQRIETFRIARRMDIVQLKMAMSPAPFRWPTLLRALRGKPVRGRTYFFLLAWMAAHTPAEALPDGKAAAAGEGIGSHV